MYLTEQEINDITPPLSGIDHFAAWGIPFVYLAQMLALLKGGNPDAPIRL